MRDTPDPTPEPGANPPSRRDPAQESPPDEATELEIAALEATLPPVTQEPAGRSGEADRSTPREPGEDS